MDRIKTEFDLERVERIVAAHSTLILLKRASGDRLREINTLTLLKNSRLFLTRFQRINKEILNLVFDKSPPRIVALLDRLHATINYLKEACVSRKNASVARQSPVYLRCVEAFMLSVKELLYVNDCDRAFKMKSLAEVVVPASKATKRAGAKKRKAAANEEDQQEDVIEDEDEGNIFSLSLYSSIYVLY